jgi:hypothetical protein
MSFFMPFSLTVVAFLGVRLAIPVRKANNMPLWQLLRFLSHNLPSEFVKIFWVLTPQKHGLLIKD